MPKTHFGFYQETPVLCGVTNTANYGSMNGDCTDDIEQVTCLTCQKIIAKLHRKYVESDKAEAALLIKDLQDNIIDAMLWNVDRALEGRQGFARGGSILQLEAA